MVAPGIITGNRYTKYINLLCLLLAIITTLILPLHKEIWYDETVSMLCSKGISHDAHAPFASTATVSSATLEQLNTPTNVFHATINDNANSFLYNIGLHWFTALAGNSVSSYMLFSKLCAIAALLAFYVLCTLIFGGGIFTSVAILLLAFGLDFNAMSHEIRAYAMTIFFVTMAAIYFYRFLYQKEKPLYLFLISLFSVAAILCHFLSGYIILVFLVALLVTKRAALFTARNILAILTPLLLLAAFFWFAIPGLGIMSAQSQDIHQGYLTTEFHLSEVFFRSMRITAFNFRTVFPSFLDNNLVALTSFLFVIALYIGALKAANNPTEKRNLHLLFALGICSTVVLAALALKSHHYTSLYHRYYCFGLPFNCLFVAYVLFVFTNCPAVSRYVITPVLAIILIPTIALFVSGSRKPHPVQYNHAAIAAQIVSTNVARIEVPEWRDAFIIQSVLPHGYKIDYFRSPAVPFFVLYKASGTENIPVIKMDK